MRNTFGMAVAVFALVTMSAASARAQAVAGAEKARAVAGDPGISSMVVIDRPEFRVLRDYAEPGATRRMHSHDAATYHVFTLITGQLTLTIEGESPIEVRQGEALYLKGGAKHTFTNTGSVTSTIVEVFGKAPAAAPGGAGSPSRSVGAGSAPTISQPTLRPPSPAVGHHQDTFRGANLRGCVLRCCLSSSA